MLEKLRIGFEYRLLVTSNQNGSFYSGPPLLTTDQCSCGGNHFTVSLLGDASKQEHISISDRCCFADLFALFFFLFEFDFLVKKPISLEF